MVFGASHSFNLSRYFSSTQVKSLHQVCSAERYIRISIKEGISIDEMRLVVTVHLHWRYHQSYLLHLGRYRCWTRIVDLRSRWLRSHTRLKVAWRFLAAWVWAAVIVQQAMVRLIASCESIITFTLPWHVTSPQAVETILFTFHEVPTFAYR